MDRAPFYLGYADLLDLANVCDIRQPIYAMLCTESSPSQFTRVERDYMIVSQLHGSEMHYCRIEVGLTEWIADECLTPNWKARRERARQAWVVLHQWLVDAKFDVREAVPAMPKDYILTNGVASFLCHDPVSGYFIAEAVR